ncbi:MAG TPA: hypothetical protein VGJ16_00235 [Pirellulales bacterium]
MSLEGTRRVLETTSHDIANQYLRFGWNLINQYVLGATADRPASVVYVLASVRRLEDTREILMLTDANDVNAHLRLGWNLIDRHVTASATAERRDETIHFILAWQSDEPSQRPGDIPAAEVPMGDEMRTDTDEL